ncbi:MAG: CDGSH iron-sulfur domain-containing protein [Proteobacteria bacterium]|nr:CDGSH iron-sulfur domain-containing protein [Pseudomonadota bacterium]
MNREELKRYFPIALDVEEGNTYYWCSCGKTSTEPLCDNQALCVEKAQPFKALLTETLYFCACKQTRDPPLCDGSHSKILLKHLKKD